MADDYIGLDVLSSQMDVKVSNFRRVPGMPIYGMAQPSREVRKYNTPSHGNGSICTDSAYSSILMLRFIDLQQDSLAPWGWPSRGGAVLYRLSPQLGEDPPC